MNFGFASPRVHGRPDPQAIAEAESGWVTMHGPKIALKRRKGEETAAMACGGGGEQLSDSEAARL